MGGIFALVPSPRSTAMTEPSAPRDPFPVAPPPADAADDLPRRDFLRLATLGAGAVLAGAAPLALEAQERPTFPVRTGRGRRAGPTMHVVVVGGGVWGVNIARHLRKAGHRVTVIEQYGIANSRATSGDETRGIRSSYGDRTITPELWVSWARESIKRWREFDAEHGKRFGTRFFYTTGDLLMRQAPENFSTKSRELWDKLGVRYEVLDEAEVRKRWPQIDASDHQVLLYEPDAGVARARDSVQAMATLARDEGVEFRVGRAAPGPIAGGRMRQVSLPDGTVVTGDAFVFATGPWMHKTLPDVMGNRTLRPLGHVVYFGTPVDDARFTYPNIPTWNVPGVTGWAALPADSYGFRVRGSLRAPTPPNTGQPAGGAAPGAPAGAAPPPPPPPAAANPADTDPDLSSRWTTERQIDGSRNVLRRYFPAMAEAPVLATRACHYEISVNRNFIVDRIPGAENAWITGQGQAEGFKFSIVIGEYAAWRVMGDAGDPALAEAFKYPTNEYPANARPFGGGDE